MNAATIPNYMAPGVGESIIEGACNHAAAVALTAIHKPLMRAVAKLNDLTDIADADEPRSKALHAAAHLSMEFSGGNNVDPDFTTLRKLHYNARKAIKSEGWPRKAKKHLDVIGALLSDHVVPTLGSYRLPRPMREQDPSPLPLWNHVRSVNSIFLMLDHQEEWLSIMDATIDLLESTGRQCQPFIDHVQAVILGPYRTLTTDYPGIAGDVYFLASDALSFRAELHQLRPEGYLEIDGKIMQMVQVIESSGLLDEFETKALNRKKSL
ncbi:MAG: hypothetical protein Q3986_06400 [Akkermansia sp.]|nr:hypothetical protein [Akkermansia sp.]